MFRCHTCNNKVIVYLWMTVSCRSWHKIVKCVFTLHLFTAQCKTKCIRVCSMWQAAWICWWGEGWGGVCVWGGGGGGGGCHIYYVDPCWAVNVSVQAVVLTESEGCKLILLCFVMSWYILIHFCMLTSYLWISLCALMVDAFTQYSYHFGWG